MADITGTAAVLINKINQNSIGVILKNEELYLKNAQKNESWKANPAVDLDMISYYGLPLNWPDEKSFMLIIHF